MCFGKKEKHLYGDDDDAPRPAPGQFPQQPTYADPPKASIPQQQQQNYYPPPQPSPVSPVSPYTPQSQYPGVQPYTPAPTGPPPVELSAMPPANPPTELPTTDYAPPPGPPPSHSQTDYAPPPGPPPSAYDAPPPGPPPSKKTTHDWETAVPDTSLFPPPPALFTGFDRSPANNATEAEAIAGENWCAQYPLTAPLALDQAALAALRSNDIRLMTPAHTFRGSLAWRAPGVWDGKTDTSSADSTIIGYPPLYSVRQHSPLATGREKTVYYEVKIKSGHKGDICVALGFTALPYPSFRMPGWHRGSLAVHGDDGHKYINDRWGGKTFTEPFRKGETYGVGMKFSNEGGRIGTEIFFTREGRVVGGWNLHEETDAQEDLPVTGLEGFHDLSCAIGTWKGTDFEVVFDPARWLYRG
ncbi:hypothetical protein OQA88_3543 [Cercophora sp. LCS_1]